ncbi:homoserine kinase, partial [Fagus crenata]
KIFLLVPIVVGDGDLAGVKAFAPATVANLNPRSDFLGCAVDGLVDYVSLTVNSTVQLSQIAMAA